MPRTGRTGITRILGYFQDHARSLGLESVDEVTPEAIHQFRATRAVCALTWTKELQILRHFFRFCVDSDWIVSNPAARAAMPKNIKPTDKEPYSAGDVIRIIAACDTIGTGAYERARARAMILLLRYTALRIGDVALSSLTLVGVSLPVYWLGWMLLYALGVLPANLGIDLFPISGRGDPHSLPDLLWHLVLPAVTLGTIPLAIIMKITRASMLDVLRSDYVRTARAKGLDEFAIIVRHALRNALIPIITVLGLQTGILLGGAVLTEHIFAWPGLGRLTFDAISNRDFPVINGALILFAMVFVVVGAVVDLLYAVVDPRIGSRPL